MLAGTVVVQRIGLAPGTRKLSRRGRMARPMRAALQSGSIKSGGCQHALGGRDVTRLATVRCAGQREFLVTKSEALGRARFQQHKRLQRLDSRAGINRAGDIAQRQHGAAVHIHHRQRTAMPALDQCAAQHINQYRITHL